MQIKAIVIKYKDPLSEHESRYRSSDDHYVALDANSGGYPYRTSLMRAQHWATKEKAFEYINYDNWRDRFEVIELTLNVTEKILTC